MVSERKKTAPTTDTITDQKSAGPDILDRLSTATRTEDRLVQLESLLQKVGKVSSTEAYPPDEMARKTEAVGVSKGKRDVLSTTILGLLAGVFIGLGAMFFTVVTTNSGLGFGMNKLIGGLSFCLGLILVVVAGAELFTGNTLIVMSWLSGRTSLARLLRNWGIVYAANLVGALSLVGLMFYTNQWAFSSYGVGANALLIANAKVSLSFGTALARGIMCNALVCLAVWLCFSARTVTDKIVAILFPITAFVTAGFEHSVANMYFIPIGVLLANQPAVLEAAKVTSANLANLTWAGFVGNLIPVTIGNIIGGGLLVGAIYWITYLGQERREEVITVRPWLKSLVPNFIGVKARQPVKELPEAVRIQISELIQAKQAETAALGPGGQVLMTVLARAKDDANFFARLSENPAKALEDYDELTAPEKAALSSGDIRWIESKVGTLNEPLRTWLTARLTQEKW
ncbi:MAG: formate/nitrite transporter family protein [Chloroflexota bacterium]